MEMSAQPVPLTPDQRDFVSKAKDCIRQHGLLKVITDHWHGQTTAVRELLRSMDTAPETMVWVLVHSNSKVEDYSSLVGVVPYTLNIVPIGRTDLWRGRAADVIFTEEMMPFPSLGPMVWDFVLALISTQTPAALIRCVKRMDIREVQYVRREDEPEAWVYTWGVPALR